MSKIGRMRHRIILEEPMDIPDEAGGFSRTWQTAKTLWARLEPKNAAPRFIAEQGGINITHQVTVRALEGVTSLHRFRLGARIFDIRGARQAADKSDYHILDVEEHKP